MGWASSEGKDYIVAENVPTVDVMEVAKWYAGEQLKALTATAPLVRANPSVLSLLVPFRCLIISSKSIGPPKISGQKWVGTRYPISIWYNKLLEISKPLLRIQVGRGPRQLKINLYIKYFPFMSWSLLTAKMLIRIPMCTICNWFMKRAPRSRAFCVSNRPKTSTVYKLRVVFSNETSRQIPQFCPNEGPP